MNKIDLTGEWFECTLTEINMNDVCKYIDGYDFESLSTKEPSVQERRKAKIAEFLATDI
jgi:hypothetical protein